MLKKLALVLVVCFCCNVTIASTTSTFKSYQKTGNISGNLNSIGSDTVVNLMTGLAESFCKIYPNVRPQIEGKGSATAPTALTEGTAQLGPMSREMKTQEIELFEKKYGYKPTKIAVAIDCLGVFVHKDNPIKSLSLQEIDAIFSKTKMGGYKEDILMWGQIGAKDNWSKLPISLYGRNSASGTYAFFKDAALFKGDYRDSVKEQPGSASVVSSVALDRAGIGYSSIGYATSEIHILSIAKKIGANNVMPTYENAINGTYPLARNIYIYINKNPKEPLQDIVKEFLRFALSKEGQNIVIKDGMGALPEFVINKQLELLKESK